MGSGGGGGDSETTIRYASYLEKHHRELLNDVQYHSRVAQSSNPYSGWSTASFIDIENPFFGVGYVIANYPSLYDMYGKFMAGLDIEVLFDQSFEDSTAGPVINNLVSAKRALLNDEVNTAITEFSVGSRDINSVMTSSFVVGKSIIKGDATKKISEFDAELRYRMIPVAVDRWKTHLEWNKATIGMYAEIMKLYYSVKMDATDFNYTTLAKNVLWKFTPMEYERLTVGALTGATNTSTDVAGSSGASRAIGGALTGAAMGAQVGGPTGAVIGGVVGLAAGLLG